MTNPRIFSAVLALFAMIAGSEVRGQESLDPQGDYPDLGKGNVAVAGTGRLDLYFELPDLRGGSRQAQDARRPRCRVYDVKGHFLKEVTDPSPTSGVLTASLPRGAYLIEVFIPPVRWTPFWVSVAADRATGVDLSKAKSKTEHEPPQQPAPVPSVSP